MTNAAIISDCGRWRYVLSRVWAFEKLPLVWVMLNPSTADGTVDDQTIKKCVGFAQFNGYGSIYVYNLFAWRATQPKCLVPLKAEDRIGPENDYYLSKIPATVPLVAAWGSFCQGYAWGAERIAAVKKILGDRELLCVKQFGDRPAHPLYIKYGCLVPFADTPPEAIQ